MTYIDTASRIVRVPGEHGGMSLASFRCQTLKHRVTLLERNVKFACAGPAVIFLGLYDDVTVTFRHDQIERSWRWPRKVRPHPLWSRARRKLVALGLVRPLTPYEAMAPTDRETLPFQATQIRTIEASPCPAKNGQGTAVVNYKNANYHVWRVNAHLHDGQTVCLVEFFMGPEPARLVAAQLNEAHRLVLTELAGLVADATKQERAQAGRARSGRR